MGTFCGVATSLDGSGERSGVNSLMRLLLSKTARRAASEPGESVSSGWSDHLGTVIATAVTAVVVAMLGSSGFCWRDRIVKTYRSVPCFACCDDRHGGVAARPATEMQRRAKPRLGWGLPGRVRDKVSTTRRRRSSASLYMPWVRNCPGWRSSLRSPFPGP